MEFVERLRKTAKSADHVVDRAVYEGIFALYAWVRSDAEGERQVRAAAPEYGGTELLLCAAQDGSCMPPSRQLAARLARDVKQTPGLASWIQPAAQPARGVLVARWLCHLLGLRHRAVQLFIEHPTNAEYVLVQVRSATKLLYPGCLDIAAAGHVAGIEDVEDALYAELYQELGLKRSDLGPVRSVRNYGCSAFEPRTGTWDVEFRHVFAGPLHGPGLLGAHMVDGEVAALAICSIAELRALVELFPDRVASGLRDSLPLYLLDRGS